jgi:hypothetical protein
MVSRWVTTTTTTGKTERLAEEPLIAVFVDYENLAIGVRRMRKGSFAIDLVLRRLLEKGRIIYKRAYCDWGNYREAVREFHTQGVELVDIPQSKASGKNSADIHMVVDALDLCYQKEHINSFALISGDSDFSPIAVQVPWGRNPPPLPSVTRATAAPAGWIWDIGLPSRRGIGYVHSSAHANEAAALATLKDYIAQTAPAVSPDGLGFRTIRFEPGYRRDFWVKNCVAVGLSGGFMEPLEASALALIEQAAQLISRDLPASRDIMAVVAKRFNEKMHYHWQRVVEFLKLHYVLSRRDSSAYWRDTRNPSSCPAGLRDKLTLWQQQAPWHEDAPRVDELFPSASYQFVLYGMGFEPALRAARRTVEPRERALVDRALKDNEQKARQLLSGLPANRALLDAMTSLAGVA